MRLKSARLIETVDEAMAKSEESAEELEAADENQSLCEREVEGWIGERVAKDTQSDRMET